MTAPHELLARRSLTALLAPDSQPTVAQGATGLRALVAEFAQHGRRLRSLAADSPELVSFDAPLPLTGPLSLLVGRVPPIEPPAAHSSAPAARRKRLTEPEPPSGRGAAVGHRWTWAEHAAHGATERPLPQRAGAVAHLPQRSASDVPPSTALHHRGDSPLSQEGVPAASGAASRSSGAGASPEGKAQSRQPAIGLREVLARRIRPGSMATPDLLVQLDRVLAFSVEAAPAASAQSASAVQADVRQAIGSGAHRSDGRADRPGADTIMPGLRALDELTLRRLASVPGDRLAQAHGGTAASVPHGIGAARAMAPAPAPAGLSHGEGDSTPATASPGSGRPRQSIDATMPASTMERLTPDSANATRTTINVTIQASPEGADDLDDLADKINRILREQARRHGILLR